MKNLAAFIGQTQTENRHTWLLYGFVLAVLCCPTILMAQRADSLEQVLATKELTDAEKVQLYYDLSWAYRNTDIKRSIDFGKKGVVIAQRTNNQQKEASLFHSIATAYYTAGVYDTAISYLEKAQPIAVKLQRYRQQSAIYNTYANIYNVQSVYELALENYFAAVKILADHNDTQGQSVLYYNIGNIYERMGNFEQAFKYMGITKKLASEAANQEILAAVYVSLSTIAFHQGQPKAVSVDYAQKAVEIYKQIGDRYRENSALHALAQAYCLYGDYAAAEPVAQQAVTQARELGIPGLITSSLTIMSNVYLQQGQYAKTVELANEVLGIDSTDYNVTKGIYVNLVMANAYLGNPRRAEQYMERYRTASDRYASETYQNSLSGMEVKYESEKKELKIAALEKQRQLYIWLGIAGALILFIALAFAFIRYRLAVNQRKLAEEEAQRLEQEKQLVAVQATLDGEAAERTRLAKDLHDGLGSMLSLVKFNLPQVSGGAVLEATDVTRFQTALGMLDDSIQELRRVAHHMMPESLLRYGLKVSLADFCAAIPMAHFHYFGDEARLPGKLEIMAYRCIHELVNNALKHAGATQINVQLVQEKERLSFTVQDDGKGFDEHTVTEGMGLQNIRQRVAAFQGKMEIYSSAQGTEVHVELELDENERTG